MAEFKIVISDPKNGKSYQTVADDAASRSFIGLKIGDKVKGDAIGLAGYEFELAGGSDHGGFPMRKDVQGTARRRILVIQGTGAKKLGKGVRQRKTVAGNTVHKKTAQINLKTTTYGKESLEKKLPSGEGKEEAPEKEKPTPKEEKKEEKPAEKPKEAKDEKEEKPAAEKAEDKDTK